MDTNRIKHAGRTCTVPQYQIPRSFGSAPLPFRAQDARRDFVVVADLTWELRTLEDPASGSREDRWVLDVEATVDGMRAHVWGDLTLDGTEYVAVRTLHAATLYCVPKTLWAVPPQPEVTA